MSAFSTTRGLPFDPGAAAVIREKAIEQVKAEQREQERETLREHGRMLDQQQRERKQAEAAARREELRAHGRMLDQQAAAERRRKREEINACYAERSTPSD